MGCRAAGEPGRKQAAAERGDRSSVYFCSATMGAGCHDTHTHTHTHEEEEEEEEEEEGEQEKKDQYNKLLQFPPTSTGHFMGLTY